jgi:transposase-like protein
MRRDARCGFRYTAAEKRWAVDARRRDVPMRDVLARLGCTASMVCRWARQMGQPAKAGQRPAIPWMTGAAARLFVRECGSYAKAAKALGCSHAAIYRRATGETQAR